MHAHKKIPAPIATGDSSSSAIDLSGWKRLSVELPASTMASAPTVGIVGSSASAGTYYPIVCDSTADMALSSITAMRIEEWPRYIKLGSDKTAHSADFASAIHVVS